MAISDFAAELQDMSVFLAERSTLPRQSLFGLESKLIPIVCVGCLYIICIDDLYFDGGKTQQSEGEGMCAVHHRDEYPAAAGISGGQNAKQKEREADFSSGCPPSPPRSSLDHHEPTRAHAAFSDRLSIRQT